MKVRDLIEALEQYHPESDVEMSLVDGEVPIDEVYASDCFGIVYLACND